MLNKEASWKCPKLHGSVLYHPDKKQGDLPTWGSSKHAMEGIKLLPPQPVALSKTTVCHSPHGPAQCNRSSMHATTPQLCSSNALTLSLTTLKLHKLSHMPKGSREEYLYIDKRTTTRHQVIIFGQARLKIKGYSISCWLSLAEPSPS